MTEAPPMSNTRAPDPGGCLAVLVYLALSLGVILGVNGAGAVVLLAVEVARSDLAWREVLLRLLADAQEGRIPGWFLALSLSLQFPAMLAATAATRALVRFAWYRPRRERDDAPWSALFALRPAPAATIAAAFVMGMTTGWLPGWFAAWLRDRFPDLGLGAVQMVQIALTEGWWPWRVIVGLWVALGAAVVEELVFRGYLWDAVARLRLPAWGVWGLTSLVFAAYHMDPVQSSALVFTALTLGWLRWHSGSVWPCMLMHAVNNTLGVLGAVGGMEDVDLPLSVAVAGALVTLALWGLVRWVGPVEEG